MQRNMLHLESNCDDFIRDIPFNLKDVVHVLNNLDEEDQTS